MTIRHLSLLVLALLGSLTASAQEVKRIPLTPSQNPTNAELPFSQAVWAGDTLYVSGWLDPDRKSHTDLTTQTVSLLGDVQKFLMSQNLTLGDVVMMHMYIGGNSKNDGRADVLRARAGYSRFFGTTDQPNKPACTTVHVVLPAGAGGALIEMDFVVVRPTVAKEPSIVGTWTLIAAEKLLPDGQRLADYGPNPHGQAIFTADGYYSVQVYRSDRLKFASGDKFVGTPEEYKDASLSASVHFGRYSVDPVKHTITFMIERSSVPNLDDTTTVRSYELEGDVLSWRVKPRQDGSIPTTTLRRAK